MKEIRPLHNEADYDWALNEVNQYFEKEPEPGSMEGDRFELLLLVIGDYESKHYPMEPLDAPEMLRGAMANHGWTQADLAKVLGSKSRASEVLNRKRHLTLEQIWKIREAWKLPAEALIKPYPLRKSE